MQFLIETDPLTLPRRPQTTIALSGRIQLNSEGRASYVSLVYLWDNPWTRRYETENDQFTLLARDGLGSSATQFGKLPNPGANKLQLSSLASIEAVI